MKAFFLICYIAGVICCLFWVVILGYSLLVQHEFSWRSLAAIVAIAVFVALTRVMRLSYYEEKRGAESQESNL